jgi:hypothetical protein
MSYVENLVNNLGKKEPFKAFTLRIPESQANLIEEHALRLNVHRQTLDLGHLLLKNSEPIQHHCHKQIILDFPVLTNWGRLGIYVRNRWVQAVQY